MITTIRLLARRFAFWLSDRFEWAFDDSPPPRAPALAPVAGWQPRESNPGPPSVLPAPAASAPASDGVPCDVCGAPAIRAVVLAAACGCPRHDGAVAMRLCSFCSVVRFSRAGIMRV